MLLVRPRKDLVTETLHRYAGTVKKRFEANGWQVLDLAANDAVRSKVEEFLRSSESCVFLFYGHGKRDEMVGQDGTSVIDLDNLGLLENQKVYVVTCWTTKQLGREAENIAHFYLGYNRKLWIWFNSPYTEALEVCVNKGILEMLESPDCTIAQARQYIIEAYTHWIDYFAIGAGASDLLSFDFAADLRLNRDALAPVFGDGVATLVNNKPNPADHSK